MRSGRTGHAGTEVAGSPALGLRPHRAGGPVCLAPEPEPPVEEAASPAGLRVDVGEAALPDGYGDRYVAVDE